MLNSTAVEVSLAKTCVYLINALNARGLVHKNLFSGNKGS